MKKQRIKYLLTVICMLAAGICYSYSKGMNQVDLDGRTSVMVLETEQTSEETGVQSGLISAETEAGEESLRDPGEEYREEPMPWQAESVRFYVHICGEVKSPGVYDLEPGSRIFQAVEAAGGFTQEAAGDYLNMAQETVDGMKITVPSREEIEAFLVHGGEPWIQIPDKTGSGPLNQGSREKINLNTATKEELMTLRGIGEAKATDIIRYREEQGPFQTIEEIMNISGIKEAAFQKIKEDITV